VDARRARLGAVGLELDLEVAAGEDLQLGADRIEEVRLEPEADVRVGRAQAEVGAVARDALDGPQPHVEVLRREAALEATQGVRPHVGHGRASRGGTLWSGPAIHMRTVWLWSDSKNDKKNRTLNALRPVEKRSYSIAYPHRHPV
jgi:hypothetical protein